MFTYLNNNIVIFFSPTYCHGVTAYQAHQQQYLHGIKIAKKRVKIQESRGIMGYNMNQTEFFSPFLPNDKITLVPSFTEIILFRERDAEALLLLVNKV
jgi:hypothetical protein